MSVAPDTYISRTLATVGWDTVPEGATPRYPEVDPGVLGGQVDRLLLSSEPYRFGDGEVAELRAMLPTADIRLIDGEMTSWYGPRAIEGLACLAVLRRRPGRRRHGKTVVSRPPSPVTLPARYDGPLIRTGAAMVRSVALPLALAALVASAPAWSVNVFRGPTTRAWSTTRPNRRRPRQKSVQVNASPAVELRFSSADERRATGARRLREASRDADDRRLRRETEEWRQAQYRQQMMAAQQGLPARRCACSNCESSACGNAASTATAILRPPVGDRRAAVRQSIQQASPFPVGGNSMAASRPA